MGGNLVVLGPDSGEADVIRRMAPEGVVVEWVDSTLSVERQAAQLEDAVAIIPSAGRVPLEIAKRCPNLRLVQTLSAGTDTLDVKGLGEMGVRTANNGGGNAVAVAEHAIALIISVYRKLRLQFESAQAREWAGDIREAWRGQVHELTGKTVGIVGLGHIGQAVARRLRGWECELVYYDVVGHSDELERGLAIRRLSLDELLRESDVVSLHVPHTGRTGGMIGAPELSRMKDTAVLINTGRGPVIDETALADAIRRGEIAGAGLDVLEEEPTPADNPLLDMDRVVVTPHMAGNSVEAYDKSREFAVANVTRVIRGEEPQSVVLPE